MQTIKSNVRIKYKLPWQLNYQTVSDFIEKQHIQTTWVASSIPARSHTFVEIDHEIISTVILLLPLIYSRRVVVSYKRKYVQELLVNRLFKPAQEKVWLGELTVPQ